MINYKTGTAVLLLYFCIANAFCKKVEIDPEIDPGQKTDTTVYLKVETPRINSVSISAIQPQEKDTNVIWFDDFDENKSYMESRGELDKNIHFGDIRIIDEGRI